MSDERNFSGGGEGGGGDRKVFAKPKFCQFCADKQLIVEYKKIDLLRKYITEDGKIRPRRQTGACAKHQRVVAAAIKQAPPCCASAFQRQGIGRYSFLIAERFSRGMGKFHAPNLCYKVILTHFD